MNRKNLLMLGNESQHCISEYTMNTDTKKLALNESGKSLFNSFENLCTFSELLLLYALLLSALMVYFYASLKRLPWSKILHIKIDRSGIEQ